MTSSTLTQLTVHAIDPARLEPVYRTATDGHGNRPSATPATGEGEPLRCCLRYARPDEQIMLISFAPFDHPSVWTEVGPVYVHAAPCRGFAPTGRLPQGLDTGPVVLRTYRADGTMNYEHNTVVATPDDLQPVVSRLLREPDVATVHVRTLAPQCFLYAVTESSSGD